MISPQTNRGIVAFDEQLFRQIRESETQTSIYDADNHSSCGAFESRLENERCDKLLPLILHGKN